MPVFFSLSPDQDVPPPPKGAPAADQELFLSILRENLCAPTFQAYPVRGSFRGLARTL
jgi:hypothetical protein